MERPDWLKNAAVDSPEALLALAEAHGTELTKADAQRYFALLQKTGEMSEDELENVSGGSCGNDWAGYSLMRCACGYEKEWVGNFTGSKYDCPACGKAGTFVCKENFDYVNGERRILN